MSDYDQEVKKINSYNQPILDGFQAWLTASGLAPTTVKKHIENIEFFAEYLTYYEPLYALDEADSDDILSFLLDWYPRKAMWASPAYTKAYITTLRKFFKYMSTSERVEQVIADEVYETLKERKADFLEAVEFDEDEDDYDW